MSPPTLVSHAESPTQGGAAWCAAVRVALLIAVAAMLALQGLQPDLSPIHKPVSFYVHGRGGWLLTLALASFGAAALAASVAMAAEKSVRGAGLVRWFAVGILMTAIVPCDPWFPWEAKPSPFGLVHAAAALLAPPLLVPPMLSLAGRYTAARSRVWMLLLLYGLGMLGSAASLAVGFAMDQSPPFIGAAERLLALSAVAWFWTLAGFLRRPAPP